MAAVFILIVSVLFAIYGCATDQKKVRTLDTELSVKGHTGDGVVGLDKDGDAVLQIERDAITEYQSSQMANAKLREMLRGEMTNWRRCREYLADPRLGGPGEVEKMPPVFSAADEGSGQFGMNEEGQLVLLSRAAFDKAISAEQRKTRELNRLLDLAKEENRECQRRLGYVRVKYGLPAKPYEPILEFDENGNATIIRNGETSLDDAFRIQRQQMKSAGTSS